MNDLNEWLKERRRIHDAATEGPWGYIKDTRTDGMKVFRVGSEITGEDLLSIPRYRHDGDGVHIADAVADAHNTLPVLLTAIEKVLELHAKETGGTPDGGVADVCSCGLSYWPCPTVQAVRSAIEEEA